jgi:transcriptional regulator with XRE-family HTH domain
MAEEIKEGSPRPVFFAERRATADELRRSLAAEAERERLRRGEFEELVNLRGLGRTLVALRTALGITQRELGERLGVHETQVCRDERNDYHSVSLRRASQILEALGVTVASRIEALPAKVMGRSRQRTRRNVEQAPDGSRNGESDGRPADGDECHSLTAEAFEATAVPATERH